jgi:transcriptional regulator with XRE-family HTH domain
VTSPQPDEPFALRLRSAMLERRMSIRALAQVTGLGETLIARYRDMRPGAVRPTANSLRLLADGLNCSADYLLGRTDKLDFTPAHDPEMQARREALYQDITKGKTRSARVATPNEGARDGETVGWSPPE